MIEAIEKAITALAQQAALEAGTLNGAAEAQALASAVNELAKARANILDTDSRR